MAPLTPGGPARSVRSHRRSSGCWYAAARSLGWRPCRARPSWAAGERRIGVGGRPAPGVRRRGRRATARPAPPRRSRAARTPAGAARGRTGQARRGRRPNRTGSIRRVAGREGYWRADLTVGGTPYRATGPRRRRPGRRLQEKIAADGRRPPGAERPDADHRRGVRAGLARAAPAGDRAGPRGAELGQPRARGQPAPPAGDRAPDAHRLTAARPGAALRPPAGAAGAPRRQDRPRRQRHAAPGAAPLPRDFGLPNVAADVDLPRRERGLTQYPLRADEVRPPVPAQMAHARPRRRPVAARLVRPQPLGRAARPEVGRPGPGQPGAAPPAQPAALGGRRARAAREGRRQDRGQPARARAHRRAGRGPAGAPPAPGRGAPAAGQAWVPHDLIFCTRYGTPLLSGTLLRRFRACSRPPGCRRTTASTTCATRPSSRCCWAASRSRRSAAPAGHASPAVTSALYAHAVRRVPARLLGALGEFYRTGHPEHEAESGSATAPVAPVAPAGGQADRPGRGSAGAAAGPGSRRGAGSSVTSGRGGPGAARGRNCAQTAHNGPDFERAKRDEPALTGPVLLWDRWLRGQDSNLRPSGYEPDELPLLHPAPV